MSKIIQITEDSLRRAVESGDLKQLAPEVFEKKKVTIEIRDVYWDNEIGVTYPVGCICKNIQSITTWPELVNKPQMLMTLEWEE